VRKKIVKMREPEKIRPFEHTIDQQILENIFEIRERMRDDRKRLSKAESYVKAALRCGSRVEPGDFEARLPISIGRERLYVTPRAAENGRASKSTPTNLILFRPKPEKS